MFVFLTDFQCSFLRVCLTCITMEIHCILQWYVLSFTYFFSRCCLQYASILQAGIIFQAVTWLLFVYIPEQNGPLLVV